MVIWYALCVCVCVCLHTTDPTSSLILQLLDCLTSIGFSLTNGTIAMKVIRIWYIHNRPKLNKKLVSPISTLLFPRFTVTYICFPQAIRDVHIFVAIMILVGLDIIIIGFYLLIGGLKGKLGVTLIPNRENPIELIGVSHMWRYAVVELF